jgi:DnaJ-domain-containing protein 1
MRHDGMFSTKEKIALSICRRQFALFWDRFREDAFQESRAAAWAHRDLEGISFLRATYRDLYKASLAYACRKSSTGNGGPGTWYLSEEPTEQILLPCPEKSVEEQMVLEVYGRLLRSRSNRAGKRGRMAAMQGAILLTLTKFYGEDLNSAAKKVGLNYQAAKQARLRALRVLKEEQHAT